MKVNSFNHLYTENIMRSKNFFEKLGFKTIDAFSNEESFGIELNKSNYLMILSRCRFQSFHPELKLAELEAQSSILSFQLKTKEHVDRFMKKVIKNGGIETDTVIDDDYVYLRSFKDFDFHQFEVFMMKKLD